MLDACACQGVCANGMTYFRGRLVVLHNYFMAGVVGAGTKKSFMRVAGVKFTVISRFGVAHLCTFTVKHITLALSASKRYLLSSFRRAALGFGQWHQNKALCM